MGSTLNIFIKRSIMQLQCLLFLLVLPFVVTQIPSNHHGHVDSCFQKHCNKEQFFACLTKDEDVPLELQEEGMKGYDLCYNYHCQNEYFDCIMEYHRNPTMPPPKIGTMVTKFFTKWNTKAMED